jgi:hypothetical protein
MPWSLSGTSPSERGDSGVAPNCWGCAISNTPDLWRHRLESEVELEMLRAALGADELKAALARGAALDLDQVVAEILACEAPEAYWGGGLPGS